MNPLNDIRKMSSAQRKELLSSIEREEELEQEQLKNNPNLHLEKQMDQIMSELKHLRRELELQKNVNHSNKINIIDTIEKTTNTSDSYDILNDYEYCSLFSFDWLPFWIFFILLFISLLTPSKPSTLMRPFSI